MTVMRFFFDFTSEEKVIFDYLGLEFKSSHGAIDFAQEKLQLLKNSLTQEWVGWSIQVCSAEGAKLCTLPIDGAEMTIGEERMQAVLAHH
jgi:Domain of unknown function (DUF6894)